MSTLSHISLKQHWACSWQAVAMCMCFRPYAGQIHKNTWVFLTPSSSNFSDLPCHSHKVDKLLKCNLWDFWWILLLLVEFTSNLVKLVSEYIKWYAQGHGHWSCDFKSRDLLIKLSFQDTAPAQRWGYPQCTRERRLLGTQTQMLPFCKDQPEGLDRNTLFYC